MLSPVDENDDEISMTSQHAKDLDIPCPREDCQAKVGEVCKGLPEEIVHFARRLQRLAPHMQVHHLGQHAAVRKFMLSLSAQIPAGTTMYIEDYPQLPFKMKRIVYTGPKETFRLLDIRVGTLSQTISRSYEGIPLEMFPPHDKKMEVPYDGLNGTEVIKAGQRVAFEVKNVTNESRRFDVLVYGLTVF